MLYKIRILFYQYRLFEQCAYVQQYRILYSPHKSTDFESLDYITNSLTNYNVKVSLNRHSTH